MVVASSQPKEIFIFSTQGKSMLCAIEKEIAEEV
jgi:hypothetical protein